MFCLTELYDGRDVYRIYYIKKHYMFQHYFFFIYEPEDGQLKVPKHVVVLYVIILYISPPSYSCVTQVYTLQYSILFYDLLFCRVGL